MMLSLKSQFHRSTFHSHQGIDCIFEMDIECHHVDSLGSGIGVGSGFASGSTQFNSIPCESNRFDSLDSFHQYINHVSSAWALIGDFALYRFGEYVLQVRYVNIRNVIDYEMVNFTHATSLRIVQLLSWFNRFRYWATHNQHTHMDFLCIALWRTTNPVSFFHWLTLCSWNPLLIFTLHKIVILLGRKFSIMLLIRSSYWG